VFRVTVGGELFFDKAREGFYQADVALGVGERIDS
jgi:hypothetical protein